MNRNDVEVMNRDFHSVFLTSSPLRENSTGDCEGFNYEDAKIRLIDAEYMCFYKYLLSLNQRICDHDYEQNIKVEYKFLKNNIWEFLYEELDNLYGLCLSKEQTSSVSNPFDSFIRRVGLEPREFNAIKILLGVMHINIASNSISLYSDSNLIKDVIDHYIALSILWHIDLRNSAKNENKITSRNRRTKKCTLLMVFNKIYRFNKKVLSEPASTRVSKDFPNIVSASIDTLDNSLMIHKKMLLSDASFKVLEGKNYTGLQNLINQSQKIYKNLVKKEVEGNYALNESFLLEQLDEQTCCLPISLLHKWLYQQNVSYEIRHLLYGNYHELNSSFFLFLMLLCNLPHYMSVSVLKRFSEIPTNGLFTNKSFINTDELIDYDEAFLNIELLNQVLLVFLFDIFPFIDQTIKSIIEKSNDECLESYKLDSYNALSSLTYNQYQKELNDLYNKTEMPSYYDCDIVQYLDSFLDKPLSLQIQQKDGIDIVKGDMKFREVAFSQANERDSLYNITHQCILDLFIYLYNEYRVYLHRENTYKSGHSIFIEESMDQSNPQSISWASKDIRWNKKLETECLTDLIYTWIKKMYTIDSSYVWGRLEDERLVELLKIQEDESTLIRGLTKYRYHYNDTFELSDPMKNVKKALTKFFKCFYAVLNCKDIEGKPLKKFVLQDEYLKAHINNSVSDTFDKRTFWLYLPYLNDDNINEFLDSVVTCGTYSLRKSYLGLYDMLEQFLWNISLYLEKSSIENQESFSRLKKAVIDKLICEPMQDRRLFNGRPNLRMQFNELLERDNN